MTAIGLKVGDAVRVDGWKGVAFRIVGHPRRWDPQLETWEDDPHYVKVCMIGDDRIFTEHMDDVHPLDP